MVAATMRAMRELCGLSQQALADMAGVSRRTVVRWERGQFQIPEDVATMLCSLVEELAREVRSRDYMDGMGIGFGDDAFENAIARATLLTAKVKGYEPVVFVR